MAITDISLSKLNPATAKPRVFIGLPVYNGSRFLSSALDSLLAQSYVEFTLLISDNASIDDTKAICERYARADERVRYVRQERNIGAPANWNFVANQADGDYFKWATANDECAPDMLEKCVSALDADPSAVLCQGVTCLVDEESDAREIYNKDLALLDSRPSSRLRKLGMRLALNNGQSGLIRLLALRRTGLDRPYPDGDIPLMAELALLGKFIVLPEVMLYRRMGPSTFACLLAKEQFGAFYGEQAEKNASSYRLRQHMEIMNAALCLPDNLREKLASLTVALRRLVWDRANVLSELRQIMVFK